MKFRGGHGLLRAAGSVHRHAPNPKELLVARNHTGHGAGVGHCCKS